MSDLKCRVKLEKAYRLEDHSYEDKASFFQDKKDEFC